jgi:hypothetical protein
MLKGNPAGLKINQVCGIRIANWTQENKARFVIYGDGDVLPKCLRGFSRSKFMGIPNAEIVRNN